MGPRCGSVQIMQGHYPERVTRIVVVNVPFFIGSVWSMIATVLPKSVQDRIELSSNPARDLQKYIPAGNIPKLYQGQSPLELGESEEEVLLRQAVQDANQPHGVQDKVKQQGALGRSPLRGSRDPLPSASSIRPPRIQEMRSPSPLLHSTPSSSPRAAQQKAGGDKSWSWLKGLNKKPKQVGEED